jgi:hypothetical protein
MDHSFDIDYAQKYGVEEAILIKNIQFWILKNKANSKHKHDGRTWTYNSISAFSELFPYFTEKQVRRIIESLKRQEIIITGNYNQSTYDRTLWYAFLDESIFLGSIIHLPKRENGLSEKGGPIPDIKPDSNTNNKHIISKIKLGEFKNVLLTENELNRLKNDYKNWNELIYFLDSYIQEKGYKSKDHNLAIRRWVPNAVKNTGYTAPLKSVNQIKKETCPDCGSMKYPSQNICPECYHDFINGGKFVHANIKSGSLLVGLNPDISHLNELGDAK